MPGGSLPGEPDQFHLWPGRGQGFYSHVTFMPVLLMPVNIFLGQVIGNAHFKPVVAHIQVQPMFSELCEWIMHIIMNSIIVS